MSRFKTVTAGFSAVFLAAALSIAAPSAAQAQGDNQVDTPVYGDNVEFLAGVNVEPGRAIAVNGAPVTSTLFTPPTVKRGDTVRVAWDVSVRGVESNNHIQTSRGFLVSLPEKYTKNVSFTYTGMPKADGSGSERIPETKAAAGRDASVPSAEEYANGQRGFTYQDQGTLGPWAFTPEPEDPSPTDPDTDESGTGDSQTDEPDVEVPGNDSATEPSETEDPNADEPETPRALFKTTRPFTPLHYYMLDATHGGVTTFRIEADVDTSVFPAGQSPADFFVPVRVENAWRCFDEGGGSGGYDDGCQSLLEYRAAATSGLYDPVAEDGSPYIKSRDFDINGLYGDAKCSVTHETGDPFRIGTDMDHGTNGFDYTAVFRLHDNPAVKYVSSNDDLCDRHVAPIRIGDSNGTTGSGSGSLDGGSLSGSLGNGGSTGSSGSSGSNGSGPGTIGSLPLGSLGSIGGSGSEEGASSAAGSLGSNGPSGGNSSSQGAGSLGSQGSSASADGSSAGSVTLSPQCILTGAAIALPILVIGPIAAAGASLPGVAEAQAQIDGFLSQSNDDIQHRLGIYNEDSARRIAEINTQLASIGADVQGPATAIGGTALALLAVGALAHNCVV